MQHRLRNLGASGAVMLALLLSMVVPTALPASAAPALQISRSVLAPGDSVTVTGGGFTPGSTIVVSTDPFVGGQRRLINVVTQSNGAGSFAAVVTFPSGTNRGFYTITARDAQGHAASQSITVRPRVVLQAGGPTARISVAAGRRFFADAVGFQPGETVTFTASFPLYNGNTVTVNRAGAAGSDGAVGELLLTVPLDARNGDVTLTATGARSGKKASVTITVTHQPVLTLTSSRVFPGGMVSITGSGFVPQTNIHVILPIGRTDAGPETLAQTVTTDSNGTFRATLSIPSDTRAGVYSVTATDETGGFRAQRRVTVSRNTTITLQTAIAYPNTSVTITGSNFSSSAAVVVSGTFALSGGGSQTVSKTVTSSTTGTFSVSLTVPAGAVVGLVTITARGPHTEARAQLTVVRLSAALSVQPNPAAPGQLITVTGAGFSANVPVTISAAVPLFGGGSRTISVVTQTNAQGRYAAQLRVPRHAASGTITVTARAPHAQKSVAVQIGHIASSVVVTPHSAIPGSSVTVSGTGFGAGSRIDVSVIVHTFGGGTRTLTLTSATNAAGRFSAVLQIPTSTSSGTYTVVARSTASGRTRTATLQVVKLAPSIVVTPASGAPGSTIAVTGFGFAAGSSVTLSIHAHQVGTATAGATGRFSVTLTIPHGLASGAYHVVATSRSGRRATASLAVSRHVSTRFYFASFFTGTGHHEYLALLNPSAIQARVTISYQRSVGAAVVKTLTINAHTRVTEDVNADLGTHVSAGAVVSADVPIAAERMVYLSSDGAVVPGVSAPSTLWYFADGNTSHGYREYLAIENPNSGPVQVGVTVLPTHHRAFTIYRTLGPTSRTTVKVNSYVHDAVGVRVTSNGPVVVNRTIFIHAGMTSKIGVRGAHRTWYFAGGPRAASARHWIAVINPFNQRTYVTLRAYGPYGRVLGSTGGYLPPHARKGYLINRIAHQTDVAVLVTASHRVVAEQTTYDGNRHFAATETFGVPAPSTNWEFAAASTLGNSGQSDILTLFNPSRSPAPIVVQFITSSGTVVKRTYVVGPLDHQRVDVGSVVPGTQLGIVASSSQAFVAMNRNFFNGGRGSATSTGIHS